MGVALKGLQTGLGLVVPDLDAAIVCATQQVRLVTARVVVDAVHAFVVATRTLYNKEPLRVKVH